MIKLIDGSNMLHRSMYGVGNVGVHPLRDLYIRFMACERNTIVVWDGLHSKKRRRDLFPGYKQREDKAEDVIASFDILKEVLCHTPAMQVEIPYWEADDVLYSLALDYAATHTECTIESNDQDFWQLASNPFIKLPMVTPLPCKPEDTTVYKALIGDKSDTIPGWRGFGPAKWAAVADAYLIDHIRQALETKDWEHWQLIPWPAGLTVSQETFFQCCIYYEVVTMIKVPESDFTDNYICGKSSPAHAELILDRWRI